jgi:hypothetical protein
MRIELGASLVEYSLSFGGHGWPMGPVGDVSAGDSHHLPEILFTWVTGAFFSVPFGFVGCFILVVLGPDREEFGISGFSKASLYTRASDQNTCCRTDRSKAAERRREDV